MVTSSKRLRLEYKRLMDDPTPMCIAVPLEDNILEWRYVIKGEADSPYAGGIYMGRLKFPDEYPWKPPHVQIITPNGRFQCEKDICLSISSYHPESWSPSWTVGTILLGIISFMYQSDDTVGAINTSDADKRRLAAASIEFNKNNKVFMELFGDDGTASTLLDAAAATLEANKSTAISKGAKPKEEGGAAGAAGAAAAVDASARTTKKKKSGVAGILAAAGIASEITTDDTKKEASAAPSTVFENMNLKDK